MGRTFDGGYAEYCCVPVAQVLPFRSDLDWTTLGAMPVMLATGNGSLTVGLDAKEGQSLLIRGGTSSVGMAPHRSDRRGPHSYGGGPRRREDRGADLIWQHPAQLPAALGPLAESQ